MVLYSALELLLAVSIPSFKTFKALRRKRNNEIVLCATYWVSYSAFKMCTFILDKFVFWIPFYDFGKLMVILWLSMAGGASLVAERFIFPWLKQNERRIDRLLNAGFIWAKQSAKKILRVVVHQLQQQIQSEEQREHAFDWLMRTGEAEELGSESGDESGKESGHESR